MALGIMSATPRMGSLLDGTATAPSLYFANDADTGFFSPVAGAIGFSIDGVERLRYTANTFNFREATTVSTNTGALTVQGGPAATSLTVAGSVTAGAPAQRDIVFQTGNAANPQVLATRLTIGSNATTAVATWANITHTGIVLSGSLDANSQGVLNMATSTLVAGAGLAITVDNDNLNLYGGGAAAGRGAYLILRGFTNATAGQFVLSTPNAAGNADVARLSINGAVATATATWTNINTMSFDQATTISTAATTNLTLNALTTGAVVIQSGGTEFFRANNTGVGFFAVAPVARQTGGANLTNNVTAGGVNDTIANFTDLSTYANDAAAIRNDIYQLARTVKQDHDALRAYGLLT